LGAQILPADLKASVIVVDNEAEPNNRAAAEAFAATCHLPVIYSHQPDPGIPQARNRALDEALRIGANWIAFLDDDETAEPDWLARLAEAAEHHQADVVQGEVNRVFAVPSFWVKPGLKFERRSDGQELGQASTCNVLFRASIAAAQRFDEGKRYTGGSDIDYFMRAKAAGARIVFSRAALVHEEMPASRLTFLAQMALTRRTSSGVGRQMIAEGGPIQGRLKVLSRAVGHLVTGSASALLFGMLGKRDKARKAIKKLFSVLGLTQALVGMAPLEPYRDIHGG
jgi:succinoglycan biosynthesis protein ExoM